MLPTVLGASSSNISKTMSPWFVVMVIVDMARAPSVHAFASSRRSVWPRTSVPSTEPVTRSACVRGHLEEQRSARAGARCGSPRRRGRSAATAAIRSASARPAARPPRGDDACGARRCRCARLVVRLAVAARAALLAPWSARRARPRPTARSCVLACFSIAASSRAWRGSTNVIARPRAADAARAADAVHVDVGRGRDVEVDDVGDRRDVEAARRDVGRDEDLHALVLERDHHAVAPALASCRRAAP